MTLPAFLRPLFLSAGVALALSTCQAPAQAAIILSFSGNCTVGCAGTATGTLQMADTYTLGNVIRLLDLIRFDYTSSTTSRTIVPKFVGGGSRVPGSDAFDIADGIVEFRIINSIWDLSIFNGTAYIFNQGGGAGAFTLVTTNGTSVPEPSSFVLICGGVAALAALRRRKRC